VLQKALRRLVLQLNRIELGAPVAAARAKAKAAAAAAKRSGGS
jgi:hypothetical protein